MIKPRQQSRQKIKQAMIKPRQQSRQKIKASYVKKREGNKYPCYPNTATALEDHEPKKPQLNPDLSSHIPIRPKFSKYQENQPNPWVFNYIHENLNDEGRVRKSDDLVLRVLGGSASESMQREITIQRES